MIAYGDVQLSKAPELNIRSRIKTEPIMCSSTICVEVWGFMDFTQCWLSRSVSDKSLCILLYTGLFKPASVVTFELGLTGSIVFKLVVQGK